MTVCCYTSFNLAYLPRAQVLVESLRAAHPLWQIHAVLIDEAPAAERARVDALFDGVMTLEDLGIAGERSWIFKHDAVEACTAVKGHAMVKLMQRFDTVVYLDPDIAVFHPLDDLEGLLQTSSIVLTPHQTEPNILPLPIKDNELTSMLYGIYNLGFIAVRADEIGRRFAAWWASHLHRACYDDVANGIFTDQKYCDMVPALFDRVHIHRDPGYNVASWNLSTRTVAITAAGAIEVNGRPLRFYHFTKIGSDGDAMVARYGGDDGAMHEIWEWYRRQITANRAKVAETPPWSYGRFSDGTPIPRALRLLYRHRMDLRQAFPDPFDASAGGFRQWVALNEPSALAAPA